MRPTSMKHVLLAVLMGIPLFAGDLLAAPKHAGAAPAAPAKSAGPAHPGVIRLVHRRHHRRRRHRHHAHRNRHLRALHRIHAIARMRMTHPDPTFQPAVRRTIVLR